MVRGDPAGNSTSSPLVPEGIPVPIAPPTPEPTAAFFVLPPRILPRSAPPAALPPMIPAVFFPDLEATVVMAADIGAPAPVGVTTLSNERLKDPTLSRRPFLAGVPSLTPARDLLPPGAAPPAPGPTRARGLAAQHLPPTALPGAT